MGPLAGVFTRYSRAPPEGRRTAMRPCASTPRSMRMSATCANARRSKRRARTARIWPGAVKWKDPLPYQGHALRHTYITLAADIHVNQILVRLLVGHALRGVHEKYITQMVMEGGEGLRQAQRRISRRIMTLLMS